MSFSDYLKPVEKQGSAGIPWYMAIPAWIAMAGVYYYAYLWLYISVEGSRQNLPNPALTISAMNITALSVALVSLVFLLFRQHLTAFVILALAVPLAFGSVFITA